MNKDRDYLPKCERNVSERMSQGASLSDGVSGRMTVQQKGAPYREYFEAGQRRPEKKWQGYFDEY